MATGGAEDKLRDLKSVTDSSLSYLPLEGLLDELLVRVVEIPKNSSRFGEESDLSLPSIS